MTAAAAAVNPSGLSEPSDRRIAAWPALSRNLPDYAAMLGRHLPLTTARRFISDLCWLSNRTPIGVVRRTIGIAPAVAARAGLSERPPWTMIFAKAWALVADDLPCLRQTYVGLPWPHIYEVDQSVATIMMERDVDGATWLLPARIKNPAGRTLPELSETLERLRTAPAGSIRHFRVLMLISRLPLLVRRALWLWAFNWGRQRPNYFGTFGISVLGHQGTSINFPISPLTTFVSYGPFGADGQVEVTLGFDHRTMDGAVVAEAMGRLEAVLNGPIAAELAALAAA